MNILGIETSCDETAAALWQTMDGKGRILAEKVASQIDTHARFGGVVPEVASREHLAVLPILAQQVMQQAGLTWSELDGIAVTAGPGLMGALLVGTAWARGAACVNNIPVLPVHHMEGHLLAPGLDHELPPFPFVTLLVSGGHTLLVRVDGIGRYVQLGQTIDDAAGECFDKSARLLGLPYPGGPAIAKLAENGDAKRFALPRPMLNRDNLDFSFSGLKTAVMYAVHKMDDMDEQTRTDMAASVEAAICEVLVSKSIRACRQTGSKHLLIAGGVAANRTLRHLLETQSENSGISVHLPRPEHCTDNAAMIAYAAAKRLEKGLAFPDKWDARPRWPLEELSKT
ncbi:MAG: tRNA (adenosine(37)-N6)-threonylcarbamoyltransferase complex transferase subunit TsaD [Zetaproteobacteria bacterium CG12_big_fil_rev_8_21_14_0_65_55_1124]|nr:MAG: tRNA (adenosine(37)-N6)-threonylcarbamoyltransferase complex transferase subunit TsaD [Zetaproteobacteria bacterium CG1_02_55_237]PIS20172.1 MAG: tRNA (adenosine(37)-N6)-threonylcarbamoyltransferase complex transferase subunit TsaD [Zetaproteobacteria bacterium CG08_land_8_20_14_0_20_55_17]PIW42706.1 MAG: tRNA (adenosine(37)-N6)-threonylcarbamoyltransferase complex transferase subunit TsaD [Zetaproteobacteria bacterium CG12_big_fil_rev_8_21_14_0_65_55_1124]PIY53720.1 MAG: tRNA (adenosine